MAENIRFLLCVEVMVDDPVGFQAGQLEMVFNESTGEAEPMGAIGRDIEEQVGIVAMEAALTKLRDTAGIRPIGGSTLPWKKAEDGSFPEMTLPRMPSRAEIEDRARRRSEGSADQS
ncbi:hypothetical protein AB0C04_28035 [Micromonospora sp. NPDC048909]|uniref:hypothetical protein n=1 Tax=Micromonospora sp. NPDC048909 TaxID=3155643 RepID=UPI0033E05870